MEKVPFPNLCRKVTHPETAILKDFDSNAMVCDIGSGNQRLTPSVINVDMDKKADVDVITDAHNVPFRNEVFDLIITFKMLEHVRNPWTVAKEIYRTLKRGGQTYAKAAFLEPFHGSPADYFRFTQDGLREVFKDFKELKSGITVRPSSAISGVTTAFFASFSGNLLPLSSQAYFT